jgi:hypothetical protein
VSVLRQLFDGARARAMGMGMVDRRRSDVIPTLATHVRALWSVPGRTWRLPLRQLRSAVHLSYLISSPALGRSMESFTVVSRRSAALIGQGEAFRPHSWLPPGRRVPAPVLSSYSSWAASLARSRPRRIGHACVATGIDLNPRSDKPGRQPSSSGGTSSLVAQASPSLRPSSLCPSAL